MKIISNLLSNKLNSPIKTRKCNDFRGLDIIHTAFSQKENNAKIYQTYKFSKLKHEVSLGKTKWRYSVKTCKVFLKTIG